MTIARFALRPARTSATAGYQPGTCNIGPEEIGRRRLAGHLGVAVTLVALAVLVVIDAPAWTRMIIALPAAGAASGYLQAWLKFCAGFGARGVYNFGPLGGLREVVDDEARARDRRKAREIGLLALGIGLVAGIVAVLLPL